MWNEWKGTHILIAACVHVKVELHRLVLSWLINTWSDVKHFGRCAVYICFPELLVRTTSLKMCLWRMFSVLLSLSTLMPVEGWRSFLKTGKKLVTPWELFPNPLDLSQVSFWERVSIFQRKKLLRKGSQQQKNNCHNVKNVCIYFSLPTTSLGRRP